jgi:hypothetical protein
MRAGVVGRRPALDLQASSVHGSRGPEDLEHLPKTGRRRRRSPPFDHSSSALESAHHALECRQVRRGLRVPPTQRQ